MIIGNWRRAESLELWHLVGGSAPFDIRAFGLMIGLALASSINLSIAQVPNTPGAGDTFNVNPGRGGGLPGEPAIDRYGRDAQCGGTNRTYYDQMYGTRAVVLSVERMNQLYSRGEIIRCGDCSKSGPGTVICWLKPGFPAPDPSASTTSPPRQAQGGGGNDYWQGLRNCEAYNSAHPEHHYDCSVYCKGYEYYNSRSKQAAPLPPECQKYMHPQQNNPQSIDLTIASVGWIDMRVNPFNTKFPPEIFSKTVRPEWIVDVYMGLVATRNPRPPDALRDVNRFQQSRLYRSLMYCKIRIMLNPRTHEPTGAQIIAPPVLDPGWTPPFDQGLFPLVRLAFLDKELNDKNYHPAERSKVSKISSFLHPNNVLAIPQNEKVLASGLIKFRAGLHTDTVGVGKAGSPFHVPWVWNEFVLSYANGNYYLHGAASRFPSTQWYVNGRPVHRQMEASDTSFPMTGNIGLDFRFKDIDVRKLTIWPVLAAGAPAPNPYSRQIPDDSPPGPVNRHPYTVESDRPWIWTLPASDVSVQSKALPSVRGLQSQP